MTNEPQNKMPTLWDAIFNKEANHMSRLQTPNVIRIVSADESLMSVMLEAIQSGAYVFTDQINRTVIAKKSPPGFKKVHGGINFTGTGETA